MTSTLPVWWDGQLIEESAALVPAHAQGWLWGRGVFETIAVRNGQPLALSRHLDRFRAGAARLALLPPDDAALREAIAAVTRPCPAGLHRLRITLAGGETPGLELTPESGHLHLRLTPVTAPQSEPLTVLTVPFRRNEFSALSGIKSTSYAENPVALAWARERGAHEALLLNTAGDLCEGSMNNLFLVREGTVLTPSPGSGCLPGITRGLVLELCAQLDLTGVEKALVPADLQTADAVFLTNSLGGIQPVHRCDQRILEAPCPVTARLTAALEDLMARLPDP